MFKRSKSALICALIVASSYAAQAQVLTPVNWSYGVKKINATTAVVFFKATIDNGWHIYSQHVKDGGPIRTSFTFNSSVGYTLIGKTAEPKPISRMEKAFNMEVGYFENSVIFQQKIKLNKAQTTVTGTLEYMTCNDHKCLPPDDIDFSIPVK